MIFIATFNPFAASELLAEVEMMLNELEASQLEVALVPQRRFTNHGGMVRCAIQKNAKWYRDYCAAHPSSRVRKNLAPDTRIKRRDTLRVLQAIIQGGSRSKYVPALLAIAKQRERAARSHVRTGGVA
jgi:hypothetical protein